MLRDGEIPSSAPSADAAGARLEFRILGPVEVLRDGAVLKIGPRKQRLLLARLLLKASRVVSADQLIEDLWAGRPPSGAAKTLPPTSPISEGRWAATSSKAARRATSSTSSRSSSTLVASKACFAKGVTPARAARPREASVRLREGLDLWRGGALADLVGEPFTSAPHHAESAGPDLSVEEAVAYARSLEPDSAAALASRQV